MPILAFIISCSWGVPMLRYWFDGVHCAESFGERRFYDITGELIRIEKADKGKNASIRFGRCSRAEEGAREAKLWQR